MQYLLLQLGLCLESSLVIGARQHDEMMMKIIQLKDELLSGIESMLLCVLRKTTLGAAPTFSMDDFKRIF